MNIKDLYIYNKKVFWIIISIIIILVIALLLIINNNHDTKELVSNYNLVLFGSNEVVLEIGSKYTDPGFYAINDNEIVTGDVIINNNVDENRVGTYKVIYTYKDVTKERIVKIVDNRDKEKEDEKNKELKIKLNGESEINIKVGDKYTELGANAYYNNEDISSKIVVSGSVNSNIAGTYEIVYIINYQGISKSIKRTIKVLEDVYIKVTYNKTYTNQNIKVKIEAGGSNFLYLKLPEKVVTDKNYEYEVKENGTYKFLVYDKEGKEKSETINVTNIDKISPSGSCNATYENGKTSVNVLANDNLGVAYYIYNNEYKSTSNLYQISKKLNNVSVSIFDLAGNSSVITCNVLNKEESKYDYIEMHFIVTSSDDDAILIRTKDKTIMIDGGRYYNNGKNVTSKVTDYLENIGVKTIDAMIGSHVHYNHVQAEAAILDKFNVKHAYYSVDIFNCASKKIDGYYQCESEDNKYIASKLKEKNTPTSVLKAGDYLEVGEMKLYFIGPTRGLLTTHQNANSFTFILEYKGKKYMFTGDTPTKYLDIDKFTSYATKLGTNIDVDFFKWPHHGINEVPEEFFKVTTPNYVLIPNYCGCSNINSSKRSLLNKYTKQYFELCDGIGVVLIGNDKTITMKKVSNEKEYKR